jgi:signal transduction histidine kinase/DNA-binding NarL/FixJ family response regulator
MERNPVILGQADIERIFPFSIRLDRHLEIVDYTFSMEELLGNVRGESFLDVFHVKNQDVFGSLDFESFKANSSVHLQSSIQKSPEFLLQGHLVHQVENDTLVYLIFSVDSVPLHDVIHIDAFTTKQMEAELIAAKEKADSSVKAKELFLANISHEIRTPMNVIIGMAELLDDAGVSDEYKRYIDAIKSSADGLLELINDILDFSKIEAGHLVLEETPSNLHKLFSQIELTFSERARQKGLFFIQQLDKGISDSLLIDTTKLTQVLVNLVSNAVKFTNNGFVKVTAKLMEMDEEGQTIRFEVQDTGIGIQGENIDSIFKTFIQEDSTVSRKFGGTGLGLSISRSIIERMDGDIEVLSEKGVGSVFHFTLRFLFAKHSSKPTSINKTDAHKRSLKTCRILIAEDNPMNQMLISAILDKEEILYDITSNGERCIQRLKETEFDLILMDIQMPVMDGLVATKFIREELGLKIPIIALTANASKGDEMIYREAGMNDHLSKPFRQDALFEKIRLLCDKQMDSKNRVELPVDEVIKANYSLSNIEEIASGDQEFIVSIVDTFCKNTPNYLRQIADGLAAEDFEKIRFSAHQMKPSIDILMVTDVKETIREIEEIAARDKNREEELQLISEKFVHLSQSLNSVISDLTERFSL